MSTSLTPISYVTYLKPDTDIRPLFYITYDGGQGGTIDTLRTVQASDASAAVTLRQVQAEQSGYSDVLQVAGRVADTMRCIPDIQSGCSDALRNISASQEGHADTLRTVRATTNETGYADTLRIVQRSAVQPPSAWLPFDQSPTQDNMGRTWAATGNPTIAATNARSGNALQLDGSSYLTSTGNLDLGGKDFTVDGWAYVSSSGITLRRFLFEFYNPTANNVLAVYTNKTGSTLSLLLKRNGTDAAFLNSKAALLNQLFHFALVYKQESHSLTLYINGNVFYSTTVSALNVAVPFNELNVGYAGSHGAYWKGSVDEFRFFNGEALYSAAFTPPSVEKGYADALYTAGCVADTSRGVSEMHVGRADTLRQIQDALWSEEQSGFADTMRIAGCVADASRTITASQDGSADTLRKIIAVCTFDAERILATSASEDFDAERIIAVTVTKDFDAERELFAQVDQSFDTEVKIPHDVAVSPVPESEVFSLADETEVTDVSYDSESHSVIVTKSDSTTETIGLPAGTVVSDFSYNPSSHTVTIVKASSSTEKTEKVRSISIEISEQQITDSMEIEAADSYDIMELIQGTYLDYHFSMRIESMRCSNGITEASCCSDVDALLYTQLAYSVPANEQWHVVNPDTSQDDSQEVASASTHVAKIARALGKMPVLQFSDFVSTAEVNPEGLTYANLISNIFGFTARIPHKMVNCYIRGGNLYVVQRGHERNTVNLTSEKITAPVIAREIVRTTWGSSVWSRTETKTQKRFMGFATELEWYPEKNEGLKQNYTYDSDGLVRQSVTVDETSGGTTRTQVDYHYTTIKNRKFLSMEETTVTYNYGTSDAYTETRKVYHTPLNNGQEHVHGVDGDGEPFGSNVGGKGWTDKPTPYGLFYYSGWLKSITSTPRYKEIEMERTLHGISLFDTSFPVVGDAKLIELTNDLRWLNRKTKETISFDVYDYPHLIDFNDRVVLGGSTYFVQSNKATRNTSVTNRQSLTLVRWY